MINAAEAIGYLVSTSGNAKLAALRASKERNEEVTDAQLLVAVSSDPTATTALATQMRVLLMLRLLDTVRVTEMAYLESIQSLSAKDTANAYFNLLKAFGTILAPVQQQPQGNTLAALLTGLPPQVRESVQYLLTVADPVAVQTAEGATPITHPPVTVGAGYAGGAGGDRAPDVVAAVEGTDA